jgi:hypothetical protein
VALVVECLPSKNEALNSNPDPSTTKKQQNKNQAKQKQGKAKPKTRRMREIIKSRKWSLKED